MENGLIKDHQIRASPAFNNNFIGFGSPKARLNRPGGYRANRSISESAWIEVDLENEMVITAIATQGYSGDPKVQEWVTKYMVWYSSSLDSDYIPMRGSAGSKVRFVSHMCSYRT